MVMKNKRVVMSLTTFALLFGLVGCTKDDVQKEPESQKINHVTVEEFEKEEEVSEDELTKETDKNEKELDEEFSVDTDNDILDKQIKDKVAFTSGLYKLREIPKGYYLFLANKGDKQAELRMINSNNHVESFVTHNSFDYVYIPNTEKIELTGILIPISELKNYNKITGLSLYKSIIGNKDKEYTTSGTYKVGMDIEPTEVFIKVENPKRISRYSIFSFTDKNDMVVEKTELVEEGKEVKVLLEKGKYLKLTNSTYTLESTLAEKEKEKEQEKEQEDEKKQK